VNNILTIGYKEFRDRLRSGWVIACILVWLAVISFTSLFGLIQIGQIGVEGYERTTIGLLNLAQYLVPLLGLLVGHDLIVREREDRTLNLVLASGATRTSFAIGKFLGGALTVVVPLVTGFAISGVLIGFAARDVAFAPFLKLALSGIALGIAFCGLGLLLSTFARSRVQALVCALLAWGMAVFAFDLGVLGVIVLTRSVDAAQEIEVVCDPTHVNSQADIHAVFDNDAANGAQAVKASASRFFWVWLNPVDVFRITNLPNALSVPLPISGALAAACGWIVLSLGAATCRLKRIDL
jgi:Cu-processing system permease protein